MMKLPTLTPRQYLIVAHDLIATALGILASFYIRFEGGGLAERLDWLLRVLPGFVIYAGFIYLMFGLHASKWGLTSPPDLSKNARRSHCRCWCSTTSWYRRRSMGRSSSARSPSRSTGSCRWRFSPARASPTG